MDKLSNTQKRLLKKAEEMMRESICILKDIDFETESFSTLKYHNAYVNTKQTFDLFVDGINE